MASTYLSRSISSTGNRKTSTWSAWIKKSAVSGEQVFLNFNATLNFYTDGTSLRFNSGGGQFLYTSALQRDVNGWYHFVGVIDTTQATESDRIKFYINGELQTAFSASTYPTQNSDLDMNVSGTNCYVGSSNGSSNFNGSMAHVHWIDGTAYDADTFGETDATTGIWKPKTAPSVTYGTNGFFLKFENSGAFGTDSSGNGNTFTVNGTMTQTIDTPSNVFATFNALAYNTTYNASALENGNTRGYGRSTTSTSEPVVSNLGASLGKYYFECKIGAVGGRSYVGISNIDYSFRGNIDVQYTPYATLLQNNGTLASNNTANYTAPTETSSWGSSYTTNDIIGVAMDLDNSKFYISINGTWQNSADPSTGTNGVSLTSNVNYTFVVGGFSSPNFYANFGNGTFGTTAVSSAQNPDDGIGIFEHSVPSGYKALCTKSINSQEYS